MQIGDLVQAVAAAERRDARGYSTELWETGPLKSEAQGLGLSVNHVCGFSVALCCACLLLLPAIFYYTSYGHKMLLARLREAARIR